MTQIWLDMIAGLSVVALILLWLRWRNDRTIHQIWHSLETPPTPETFSPEMVADLPEPVQRYFLHAIQPGTPLATSVEIEMQGTFKLNGGWKPMQAREILSTKGFLWASTISSGLLQFRVADRYLQGVGQVFGTLWGILTVVNQQDFNITRASIGRYAIESIWLPSLLLPQRGVRWESPNNQTIIAHFQVEQEPITLTLEINAQGAPSNVMMPRWGDSPAEKGIFAYRAYGAALLAESTFGGYTIPSQVGVGWGYGTADYEETFRATVSDAQFR